MARTHEATERRSLRQARHALPAVEAHLAKVLRRLHAVTDLPETPRLLDLGAAQGLLLLVARRLDVPAVGIEPDQAARTVGQELAAELNCPLDLRAGPAELLDLPEASFDVVHAASLLEHVRDPAPVLAEARRVLRPGGVLWLCTTNRLCPRQQEIAHLPAFAWYPPSLQRRIMAWAQRHRPAWIGHTETPAVHWFTPRRLRQLFSEAGFCRFLDRWDLRLPEEGGALHAAGLRAIRASRILRALADVAVSGYSCAGIA